jgi:hypothetical protein
VEDSFDVIMSGDESWFVYLYKFDHIFATGWDKAVPKENQTTRTLKAMLTIFLLSHRVMIVDSLLLYQIYIWDYFIDNILPDIVRQKTQFCCKYRRIQFFLHMDNSKCHNARNVTLKISDVRIKHFPIHFIR